MRRNRPGFPTGLYCLLLLALSGLTVPALAAPVERLLVGSACLLPRWFCSQLPLPAHAGEEEARQSELTRQRVREHAEALRRRIEAEDQQTTLGPPAAEHLPMLCSVIAVGPRRGGGGEPCELLLDRQASELADCSEFVTKGETLLGVLQRPGPDAATGPARVRLWNHPESYALAASMELSPTAALRMVVRPGLIADPAPLRVELWDDHYLAASLARGGHIVRSLRLRDSDGEPPAGFLLGRTRIWGYQSAAGDRLLTIGVYVVPPVEPRALSYVVVWRPRRAVLADRRAEPARHPAALWPLPGLHNGRALVAAAVDIPQGAAVLVDGVCIGTAQPQAFGAALVSSFAAARQRWSLILLPDAAQLRPREITGQFLADGAGVLQLQWRGDERPLESPWLPPGLLFTGCNGPHCPAGLLVGRVTATRRTPDRAAVVVPDYRGGGAVEVVIDRESL